MRVNDEEMRSYSDFRTRKQNGKFGSNTNSYRMFERETTTEDFKYIKKAGLELDKLEYRLMN